jgi:hypothetical protein
VNEQQRFDFDGPDPSAAPDGGAPPVSEHDGEVLDALVAKIDKLWRKANDAAATPAEREAFEAKALALMERYRIDQAMLGADREGPLGDVPYGTVDGRYSRVVINIISATALAYGCRVWWLERGGHSKEVSVFGFRDDCQRAIAIARMLVTDALAQAATYTSARPADTFSFRRSFLIGYGTEIHRRFVEAAELARAQTIAERGLEPTTSAALVLVQRAEQVDQAMQQRRMGRPSALKRAGSRGFAAGVAAASDADLSGGRRVGRQRALRSAG